MGDNGEVNSYACELNNRDSHDIRSFDRINDIPYIEVLNDLELDCAYYDETSYINSFSNNENVTIISLNIQSVQAKFLELNNLIDKLQDGVSFDWSAFGTVLNFF